MSANNLIFRLSIANAIAALGTGAVVNKGLDFLGPQFGLNLDSLLAYLVGTCFALAVILTFRKRVQKTLVWLTAASVVTGPLLLLPLQFQGSTAWGATLFLILCAQFTVVFVGRTFRMDIAAVAGSKVAWVELGSAAGYAAGLLVWQRLAGFGFMEAVLFSSALYLIAAAIDGTVRNVKLDESETSREKKTRFLEVAPMISIIVFMTVAIQIVCQMFAKVGLNTDPMASFTFGTSLAPLLCGVFGFSLGAGPLLRSVISAKRFRVPLLVFIVMALLLMGIGGEAHIASLSLAAIFLSSLFYETIALVVFDRLGLHGAGWVAISMGIMGVVAMSVYWVALTVGITNQVALGVLIGSGTLTILALAFEPLFATKAARKHVSPRAT